ncbi:colipase isoform X1 [Loxodonta africana]|uniref:colipase isoform X1 n=1 Tax=Loxodonta africana TaxID=9785 RepID=UPI000540536C|nr:colipase isoform X1 [Loxodonta africana]
MEKVLVFLFIALSAVAYAAPNPRGIIINLSIYEVYYKCPCESGLTCNANKTLVGSLTNTNFGICQDVGRSKQ